MQLVLDLNSQSTLRLPSTRITDEALNPGEKIFFNEKIFVLIYYVCAGAMTRVKSRSEFLPCGSRGLNPS